MRRRLYPADTYPDGHPDLAGSLNNLGYVLEAQGRPAAAEPLFREALAMRRRLYPADTYPDGHPDLAGSLNNLASVLHAQGRPAAAEPLFRDALAMYRRLYLPDQFPGGHPLLAASLSNLAGVLDAQGRPAAAEPLYRDALAMNKRLYPPDKYPDGHPALAGSLNDLAGVLNAQGRPAAAEPLYRDALAMYRRLYPADTYPDGHPDLAMSLNNLAYVLDAQGRPAAAEPLFRDALAMRRRLYPADTYPDGHPDLAGSLNNLASVLNAQGRVADAEALDREALAMYRALTEEYAKDRSDGDALTLLASFPLARDAYLSLRLDGPDAAAHAYAAVWPSRATVSRVLERKHLAARAAATAPDVRALWEELTSLRRQRAELILAPTPRHPEERQVRDQQLERWAVRVAALDRDLRAKLPDLDRADAAARSAPADLRAALPPGAAFIDLLRYTRFAFDPAKPGKAGETRTESYVAFVVTKQQVARVELGPAEPIEVARVELGPAEPIEVAVAGWRAVITRNAPDGDYPMTLRRLVWDKLAAHLPPGVTAVYLAPDQALARVPWAALPGTRPGTVLLEDHAVAVVPHGQSLLGQLTAPLAPPSAAGGIFVVGGVDYGRAPAASPAAADPDDPTAKRAGGGVWPYLKGTEREAEQVAAMAGARKLAVTRLTGAGAGAAAVQAALPKARVAHLATHGFFADPQFRSVFQVDPQLFEMRGLERVGAGALSPLVLSGLVFAGANRPGAPGRGLLTGEALVGLDLSGLELAVLSACESGLGDTAGGEGVFGLQKALHLAGCRTVVASLWKVDDDATAALMGLFYRHLWADRLPPREALRRAQLTLYRHPGLIGVLARRRGADFTEADLPAAAAAPAAAGPTARTGRWAAFVLSGAGR
jgi:CHAT domain-containing protein